MSQEEWAGEERLWTWQHPWNPFSPILDKDSLTQNLNSEFPFPPSLITGLLLWLIANSMHHPPELRFGRKIWTACVYMERK